MDAKLKAAIIGSGNIGTDLMIKILRHASASRWARWSASIPPRTGWRVPPHGRGDDARRGRGLARLPVFGDIDFVFDATSASAHVRNDAFLRALRPTSGSST